VKEFVENERISWDGKALGVDVYHAWLIIKTPTGCTVITEENQTGFFARSSTNIIPK